MNYIQGDLLKTNRKIIAHGVNCMGAFGAGVAKQIAYQYPLVRDEYKNKYKNKGWKLGDVQLVIINEDRMFANMATQKFYGKNGLFFNYDAFTICCRKLFKYAKINNCDIAMPKIGSGYAGGEWDKIENIILKTLVTYKVEIDIHYL